MADEPCRLLIFMDTEASHGNVYFGDIIELAAVVDPRVINKKFHSLINTDQYLVPFVINKCRITRKLLSTNPYFPVVFAKFLKWIGSVVNQCTKKFGKLYFPVLCAHGGYDNDFPMLLANMQNFDMPFTMLDVHNLYFADTYLFCKHLKEDGVKLLRETQLSQAALHQKLFPKQVYKFQHQAMADVDTMIKIFLKSPLKTFLRHMRISSLSERYDEFKQYDTKKAEENLLNDNLPEMSVAAHAIASKRLLRNGLTFSRMKSFFESCTSFMDFFDKLKDFGIARTSAKSIALKLDGMGLRCRGVSESTESSYKCFDQSEEKGNGAKALERLDSGYSSGVPSSPAVKIRQDPFLFENDHIVFGDFTENEIELLDVATCKVTGEIFPEDDIAECCSGQSFDNLNDPFEFHTENSFVDDKGICFGDFDEYIEEDSSGVDLDSLFYFTEDNVNHTNGVDVTYRSTKRTDFFHLITEQAHLEDSDIFNNQNTPDGEVKYSEASNVNSPSDVSPSDVSPSDVSPSDVSPSILMSKSIVPDVKVLERDLSVCEDGGINQINGEVWEDDDTVGAFSITFNKSIPLSLTLEDFSTKKEVKHFRVSGVAPVTVEESSVYNSSRRNKFNRGKKKKRSALAQKKQLSRGWRLGKKLFRRK